MKKAEVAIILTVRSTSERFRNKTMVDVAGKPLLYWIVKRLSESGRVILAIPEGDPVKQWGLDNDISVFEGSMDDVTGRIVGAINKFAPNADYVMRGLGDCPFVSTDFVNRSVEVMKRYDGDAFSWASPPFSYTVYGASEFPRSRKVWEHISEFSIRDEREHPDLYYHRNRDKFKIVYHEPPASKFFRPYRVEVDWKEDVEMVQELGRIFGYLPSLDEALDYFETHDTWRLNIHHMEKTGLVSSYSQADRQMWWESMRGKPIVMWDNSVLDINEGGQPIYCRAKTCLLGYAKDGVLYTGEQVIKGDAHISCKCGSGRSWYASKS